MIARIDRSMLVRFEIVNRRNRGTNIGPLQDVLLASFTLPCGIQDIQYAYPQRMQLNKTFGGGWVNDFGEDFPAITLNTQIRHRVHYRPRNLTDAMDAPWDLSGLVGAAFGDKVIMGIDILRYFKALIIRLKSALSITDIMTKLKKGGNTLIDDIWATKQSPPPLDLQDIANTKPIFDLTKGFSELYVKFFDFYNDEYWYVAFNDFDIKQNKSDPFASQINIRMTGLWEADEAGKPKKQDKFSLFPPELMDAQRFLQSTNDIANVLVTVYDRVLNDVSKYGTLARSASSTAGRMLTSLSRLINSTTKLVATGLDIVEIGDTLINDCLKGSLDVYRESRKLANYTIYRGAGLYGGWNARRYYNHLSTWYSKVVGSINRRYPLDYHSKQYNNPEGQYPNKPGYSPPAPIPKENYLTASVDMIGILTGNPCIRVFYGLPGALGNEYSIILSGDYVSGVHLQIWRTDHPIRDTDFTNSNLFKIKYGGNGICTFGFQNGQITATVTNATDQSKTTSWNVVQTDTLDALITKIGTQIDLFVISYLGNAAQALMTVTNTYLRVDLIGATDGSESIYIPFTSTTRMADIPALVAEKDAISIRYVGNAAHAYLTITSLTLDIILSGDQTDGSSNISVNISGKSMLDVVTELTKVDAISIAYSGDASWARISVETHLIRCVLADDQTDESKGFVFYFVDYPTIQDIVNAISGFSGGFYTISVALPSMGTELSTSLMRVSAVNCKTSAVVLKRTTYIDASVLWNVPASFLQLVSSLDITNIVPKKLKANTKYSLTVINGSESVYVNKIQNVIADITLIAKPTGYTVKNIKYFSVTKLISENPLCDDLDTNYVESQGADFYTHRYNEDISVFIAGMSLPLSTTTFRSAFRINLLNHDLVKLDTYQLLGGK